MTDDERMRSPLRIGEVARRTGLTVRTLRHYDDLGLLVPSTRGTGDYRLYSEDDLRRLLDIEHLKSLGLSLDEVRRALDDPGFEAGEALERHIELVQDRVRRERELLGRLRQLRERSDWRAVIEAIALTELLRHPDATVRVRATLDSPTAAPASTLVDSLAGDPSHGVGEVLTWALVQHGTNATAPLVARLRDRDPEVRLRMVHALSKVGDASAVPAVVALLADPVPEVAAKAAFALGQLGGDEAAKALVAQLGLEEGVVRDAVTGSLAHLGAADAVAARLVDGAARVREHAAEVLGYVGSPASVEALAATVADADEDVRLAVVMALGGIAGSAAGRALEEAMASSDERTRGLATRLIRARRGAGRPPR